MKDIQLVISAIEENERKRVEAEVFLCECVWKVIILLDRKALAGLTEKATFV
jgi:hypothetical protein